MWNWTNKLLGTITAASLQQKPLMSRCSTILSLMPQTTIVPAAGFKYQVSIKPRCEDCYSTRINNRRAILCRTHPRHKQIQQGKGCSKRIHKTYLWRWPNPFEKKYPSTIYSEDRYIKAFEK